jgi:hypothetical protein
MEKRIAEEKAISTVSSTMDPKTQDDAEGKNAGKAIN